MKLRLVKFLTSRENEIEKKEEGGKEHRHYLLCRHPARPRPEPAPAPPLPFIISVLSSSTQPHQPASLRSSFSSATNRESDASSYLSPAVSLLPSFFIKLPKQKSVEGRTVAGAQLADPAVLSNDNRARPARRTLASSSNRWPQLLSGSNGILSVAGGAIGKQSMKMNYPVSSPSSLNK